MMRDEFVAGMLFTLAVLVVAITLKKTLARMEDDILWCKAYVNSHLKDEYEADHKETAKP